MISAIKSFFSRVARWFHSGAAERDFNRALALVPRVAPVVESIAALAPNKTTTEVAAAYKAHGVPISQQLLAAEGINKGLLLMELATTVLSIAFPGIATRILQLAIQSVYTAIKARE